MRCRQMPLSPSTLDLSWFTVSSPIGAKVPRHRQPVSAVSLSFGLTFYLSERRPGRLSTQGDRESAACHPAGVAWSADTSAHCGCSWRRALGRASRDVTAGRGALDQISSRASLSASALMFISEVLTMDKAVADANAEPRFEMLLLGVFAAVALLLAAVDIYGVMNYSVSRRTHEIGIRMSLGASRSEVLRMVVRQGMAQALAGSVAGVVGALLLSQLIARTLYGVRPSDRHFRRRGDRPRTRGPAGSVRSGAEGYPDRAHGRFAPRIGRAPGPAPLIIYPG